MSQLDLTRSFSIGGKRFAMPAVRDSVGDLELIAWIGRRLGHGAARTTVDGDLAWVFGRSRAVNWRASVPMKPLPEQPAQRTTEFYSG